MHPVVKAMTHLGMLRVTILLTVASALMSTCVAWVFSFFVDVGNSAIHMRLAFVIPFFVTPAFSYMTALSMRESRRARIKAHRLARIDPLTELFNRRAFFEADAQLREAHPQDMRRAILFIDIDHFKGINDAHGHEGGDAVLRHFARILSDTVREGDFVARFGGEEFVIQAAGISTEEALVIAGRLLHNVRSTTAVFRSVEIPYSISIGIAPGAIGDPTDKLLSAADAQLFLAKSSGRDCVRAPTVLGTAPGQPAPRPVRNTSASFA